MGAGENDTTGTDNSFFGYAAGINSIAVFFNSFFGSSAGLQNTYGDGNTFLGYLAGSINTTGSYNTAIGFQANVSTSNLSHATAIGADSAVFSSNTIALGRPNGQDVVVIYGLGTAGGTQLCLNNSNQIAFCSSSLRYKTNIASFSLGLRFIKQLKPIEFDWKDGQGHDIGFGAEDIEKLNPLFVTYNQKGEVEGVKYEELTTVLVNAIKEQQEEIETQARQIETLQLENQRQAEKIKAQQAEIEQQKKQLQAQANQLAEQKKQLDRQKAEFDEQAKAIQELKRLIEKRLRGSRRR